MTVPGVTVNLREWPCGCATWHTRHHDGPWQACAWHCPRHQLGTPQ